ncbi:hypothetical protein SAMN05443572_106148 [Myxococcus fulvus]|uniref:Uncharacterized protein n=1 Tax=Myxococcus fulvus TaxID=33 RepID=A0A511T2N4_MYXFU|nr:hypothetical protein [Myxococcus fulvus]GEN08424.1 hypothetical protein MFU01_34610 [Myxococcus fulvus]SEU20528.1 hypothetical protein SAMN05443572_106148 [Myxococcus fulvus]
MSPKTSALEPLRVRIRRFQFIVGLGFIALVMGSTLSVSLTLRLSQRVQSLSFGPLKILVAVLLENLWLLAVLPTLCYGAGRVMELRPWKTAAGAAVSGATFVLALGFVQGGADALWLGGLGSVLNVFAFAGGVVLSARALKLGRDAAAKQTEKTQAKSEARKSEYDEFLRAAEQGGARLEQREAQGASSGAATTATVEGASTGAASAASPPTAETLGSPSASTVATPGVSTPTNAESLSAAPSNADTVAPPQAAPAPSAVETLGASTTSATTAGPLGEALPGQVIRLPEQSLSAQAPEAPESPKPPVP